ncbi:MAG: MarR family transcriptional regulator [Magnetococcales bacterium]|nr:MarR family transcriptional regulator [Magnetococcales bacterium]
MALRRIIRAIDIHSKQIMHVYGISGTQAMILRQMAQTGRTTATRLAGVVHLSKSTISGVLERLENRGLIARQTDGNDRRLEWLMVTAKGEEILTSAAPLLQERFEERFQSLPGEEQNGILAALQRITELMDATDIEAASILTSGVRVSEEG